MIMFVVVHENVLNVFGMNKLFFLNLKFYTWSLVMFDIIYFQTRRQFKRNPLLMTSSQC